MNYEIFIKNRLVKKSKPDFKQIAVQLKRARKDLATAESVAKVDPTWAFAIAYHAMIRASRALMYAKGYLPTSLKSHKTIVEFTRLILGDEYQHLVNRFNRMRRRRHDFIYDSVNNVSPHEVRSSVETARKLIDKITAFIGEENPQAELF